MPLVPESSRENVPESSTECEDCGLEYDSAYEQSHRLFCGMGPVGIDDDTESEDEDAE